MSTINFPNLYFIIFELSIYVQFSLCLAHAWRSPKTNLPKLFAGIAFGVLLELATIRQLHAYEYGRFLLMVLDVPLCIGVAWGCIIYSAMEFSNATSLPAWARPILDALLALNIDLALDAVAIRFGFWDWGRGLNFQYFGVPYANFWAWFWVVFSFSAGYRLAAARGGRVGAWLGAPAAVATGLSGVIATNALISLIIPGAIHSLVVCFLLGSAAGIIIGLRPKLHTQPLPFLAFAVPFISHAYLLIAGLVSGVILNPPFLLLVGGVMFVLALVLHRGQIPGFNLH